MKNTKKFHIFPWLTLGLGVLAALCMILLRRLGMDGRGLFIPWHWASIVLWCLTATMAGCAIPGVWNLDGKTKYSFAFPPSRLAAVGTLAAALGIVLTAMDSLTASEPVRVISGILKILAAVALVYLSWCRWNDRRASFLAWTAVTAYLMARLMFEYQSWSSQPELLTYFFPLVGSVCMTLAFYQRTALSVNMGSRRFYLFFSQMGAFFALVTLAAEPVPFYAGMAVWALTDLCSQQPLSHGKYAAPNEEDAP